MKLSCQFVTLLLFVISAAIVSQNARAESSSKERVAIFAELPDWSGIWEPAAQWSGGLNGRGDFKGPPPNGWIVDSENYRPQWLAQKQAEQSASTPKPNRMICSFGFPAVMNNLLMFEVLITPEETAMIFSRREIRHIYTDGREQPPARDLWPTKWGSSVGHWEGEELVIDTIAVADGMNPSKFSEQARFTERVKMIGPDMLQAEIRVDDPVALKQPVSTTFRFSRVTDFDRMVHDDCLGNERTLVE